MTTLEMEIAMMKVCKPRPNIVVPNVFWGMGFLHECDILALTPAGYATEIEIKVSKSDLRADKKKKNGHEHKLIAKLYFAVPDELVGTALEEIPEGAGLYRVGDTHPTELVRQCKRNPNCVKWSDKQRLKLAHLGAMRILGLKEKILRGRQNNVEDEDDFL